MKPTFKSIAYMAASILMCAAFFCSAIGFDVHTDGHDGHTYVVSLLKGTSCEDIHPEDDCACCRHHHDADDIHRDADTICHDDDDCSDEVKVLQITGTDEGFHFDFAPLLQLTAVCQSTESSIFSSRTTYAEEFVSPPPRLNLTKISVLRV